VTTPPAGRETVLTVASDPKNMKLVRALVCAAAEAAGFDKNDVKQLCLAVDEACTNVIRHAYLGDQTKRIEVRLGIHPVEGTVPPTAENRGTVPDSGTVPRLDVIVRDWGCKVDPASIKPRDLADVRPGGLGVHFIREIMDDVVYDPSGDCTELRMTKRLSKA
jgi:anti-sigma regulatory factor (Ser/Thr protein kinase)